jgi:DNA polymerase III subunit beta
MIETDIMVGTGMNVTCSRDELVARLGIVSRAVSTRSSVQILAGVRLQAAGDELHLAATDMELSLRTSLDARVEGEGAVVVPGRLLVDLARLLPDLDVQLEYRAEDGVLNVVCGAAGYRLHTYGAEDFPRLPDMDDTQMFRVDAEALLDTVAQVSRSASRDESRPVLTGILARFEPGKLVMAATDSYRLAVRETELPGSTQELEAIIPARALVELSRIAGSTSQIDLGLQDNQVAFRTEDAVLTTRRIDGQFPNVKQLLPEQFEHVLALPRSELLDVVRRVSVMAQRNSPLRLRFSDGELQVSAQTQDVGEAREALPAPFTGDTLEIGFNPEFLRDGIETVQSDEVQLKLISPLRPGLIQGEGDDYSYLIMPIRLAG